MKDGVYCKTKVDEPDVLDDSILIDEYNKSVSLPCAKLKFNIQPKSTASQQGSSIMNDNKWRPGMDVRALYSEDGEYYEAIIKEIYDEDHILVKFYGYENEETVNIKDLRSSKGPDFIREQIHIAQEELEEADDEDMTHEIDWEVGMPCRGLYSKNETVYEATIREIDETNRSALLMMTGFDVLFKAKFEEMYESIPEYRVKQEAIAQNYVKNYQHVAADNASPRKSANENANTGDQEIILPKILDSEIVVLDSEKRKSLHRLSHENGSLQTENIQQSDKKFIEDNSASLTLSHDMIKPETETDALACLISSNYLSGYYAGYYDCMIQSQKRKKDTKS